jgi:hypothetical protein
MSKTIKYFVRFDVLPAMNKITAFWDLIQIRQATADPKAAFIPFCIGVCQKQKALKL